MVCKMLIGGYELPVLVKHKPCCSSAKLNKKTASLVLEDQCLAQLCDSPA